MRHYYKLLCNKLGVKFTKRSIVITAVTGLAAVTIHGETIHSECNLCGKKRTDADDNWKNKIMVIVDEISFITKTDFELLNNVLNTKTDSPNGTRGKLLQRFQRIGPTLDDVTKINSRVVEDSNGLTESDIPVDICYAVRTNMDRNTINDAVFSLHFALKHLK